MKGLWLLTALAMIMVLTGNVQAKSKEEKGLHVMHILVAVVGNMKEPNSKTFNTLMEYTKLSPDSAYSLLEFWWAWGLRECREPIDKAVDKAVKLAKGKKVDKEQMDKIEKVRDNCIESFMFVNWDGISQSISNRLLMEKRNQ